MVPSTQHIIDTIRNEESFLKDRYFIKHIDLYGSYAKKQQHPGSDIDLLYTTIPNGNMTLARLKSIEGYLSQLLGIEKIELVSKQSINPVVAKNIENYAIAIF
ncbi:MAG: nucleotidyltransferase domain-containing protein [Ginsengibacter sp.]|jgi:predicted nucleotidyltransferase